MAIIIHSHNEIIIGQKTKNMTICNCRDEKGMSIKMYMSQK